MAQRGEEWVLYVDESGDFENDRCSCVVGLVIRDRESAGFENQLRSDIESCLLGVPWPPHMTTLNLASYRVVLCMSREDTPPEVLERCEPAVRVLRSAPADDPVVGAFLKEVDGGTEPSREELEACDGWLKVHAPGAYAQARELADEQRDGLFRVTRGLYEAYGANDVFIAAAAVPGDGTNPDDAYRSCLVALLERILGLLEEPGAPRSIRFRVATRHTNEPRLGRSIPLNAKHIVEAARLARESVQVGTAGGDAAARLVPLELVTTFDRHVKAGVVLADILANQLRFPLGLDRSWESLVADIAPRVKLFPQTNARRWSGVVLPAVAHDARARQWLEEAGPADPAERPRLGRTSPRWAGEQARAWAAVVGKR